MGIFYEVAEEFYRLALACHLGRSTKRDFSAVVILRRDQQSSGIQDCAIQTFGSNISDLDATLTSTLPAAVGRRRSALFKSML